MSKRILLIADLDNLYVKRYAERVLLPDGWEIVIFPIWEQTGKFDEWFRDNGVIVYRDTHTLPGIRRIPRVRVWARIRANAKSLAALGPFDAIHNHYLSPRDLALGQALKKRFPNADWICSFWGSDLLRASASQLRRMKAPLTRCDRITVITEPNVEPVLKAFGSACEKKTTVCWFGVDLFDDMDALRTTADKGMCKEHFGMPPHNPLICLGYNASAPHRHLEMLQALQALPAALLKDWSVVLQMTYGNTDAAYFAAVREAAAKLPCRTLVLTEFMNGLESAYLRLAADAFVLAMPTDAFSSSLLEYLYAGAHVLCGEWLPYPQLEAMEIPVVRFPSITAFPPLLAEALKQPLSTAEMAKRQALRSKYAWSGVLSAWKSLYRPRISAEH